MKNLPVPVSDDDIEAMFSAVDRNGDEQLSYREFKMMVNPPDIPQALSTHYLHNIYTLSTHYLHNIYAHTHILSTSISGCPTPRVPARAAAPGVLPAARCQYTAVAPVCGR